MIYKSEKQRIALENRGKALQAYNKAAKKFNEEEEKLIIKLYLDGKSSGELSKQFNCAVPTILKVLKDIPKRNSGEYDQHKSKNQWRENNARWKGGIKDVYDRFRDLNTYWNWRNSILKRDDNKCTKCQSASNLHAHHLYFLRFLIRDYCQNNSKEIKDLDHNDLMNPFFYDINNGITLCETCHKQWHKENGR